MNEKITLGSNFYLAKGDDARRQRNAVDSWRSLPNVDLVDVQLESAPARLELDGFRRVEKLRHDSVELTGIPGKHNPTMSEVFDLLAREAIAAGNKLFAFANTDIVLTPGMVTTVFAVAAEGCKAQVFSRMDFDGPSGADLEMIYQGQDLYVVDAAWWMQNRWRFRPYIIGGGVWDMVFTPILLCHAAGRLHNREALIRHERHANSWLASPYLAHNMFLTTLDSCYVSEWSNYCNRLGELRSAGAGPAEESALLASSFTLRPPPWRTRLKHAARSLRAFGRQWLAGARRGRFRVPPYRSVYAAPGPGGSR